jgi:heme-degrading monooxygenase HmoA
VAYTIVWEFHVPLERVAEFEAAYGPRGEWAVLFGHAAGFLGVELLRSAEQEGKFLTIDRWQSQSVFEAFRVQFASEYAALDKHLECMTATETRIGAFT